MSDREYEYDLGTQVLLADKELMRLRKNKDSAGKSNYLYENYGYLYELEPRLIPEEHKVTGRSALRCFAIINRRDAEGNKIKGTKKRCGQMAYKGSFYCRKHGGSGSKAIVHGKQQNPIAALYRGNMGAKLGNFVDVFMQDETILDLKPELAAVRTVLANYINKLSHGDCDSRKKMLSMVRQVVNDDSLEMSEQYEIVMDIFSKQATLANPDVVERISRTVETLSRIVERIRKFETQDDFMLTPDGLKIMLRSFVEVLNNNIKKKMDNKEAEKLLQSIKNDLYSISLQMNGQNIPKGQRIQDAEIIEE